MQTQNCHDNKLIRIFVFGTIYRARTNSKCQCCHSMLINFMYRKKSTFIGSHRIGFIYTCSRSPQAVYYKMFPGMREKQTKRKRITFFETEIHIIERQLAEWIFFALPFFNKSKIVTIQ